MIKILSSLVLILMLTFSSYSYAHHSQITETFVTVKPSVGALYALEDNGNMRFLCSATAVDRKGNKTVILTAWHCVRKGVSYLINFGDNNFRPLRVWKIPHYELGPNNQRAYNEPKTDMAFFLMEGTDIPIIPMADSSNMEDGELLAMVGYPLGLSKISYQGTVAGYFDRPGSEEYNYLLMQIFGAPGSSGSSVINVNSGEIVGVLVQGRGRTGLPVIFATPIDYRKYLEEVPNGMDTGEEEDKPTSPAEHSN